MIFLSVIVFAFIKGAFFSNYGLNFYDYGESLHNGVRLLEDAVLYKDVWAFLPPADNYFPALILKIFGKSLLAVRYVESLLFAFLVLVIILLIKDFIKPLFVSTISIALIFADLNSYLLFFHLFSFGSLLLAYYFIRSEKYIYIFLSGIFLGIEFLFRHDVGLVTLLTILAIFFIAKKFYSNYGPVKNLKAISLFIFGLLLIIIPTISWLIRQGTFLEFLYLGFNKAPSISKLLSSNTDWLALFTLTPNPSQLFQLFSLLMYFFYISVYVYALIWTFNKLTKGVKLKISDILILMILIFGLLQIPYAFSVMEMGHLVKAGIPALILGGFFIQEKFIRSKTLLWKLVLLSPLLLFIIGNLIVSIWWIHFNDTRVNFKYGSVYLSSKPSPGSTHPTAQSLITSLKFLEQNSKEGEYIFAAPYHALIYFLSDRKSPGRFNNFAAGFVSDYEQDEVIEAIKKNNVKVVIYDPVNAPLKKSFPEFSPKIHHFILDNYQVTETTNQGWLLMKRKDE